jgi:cell shape-determining protein MreC
MKYSERLDEIKNSYLVGVHRLFGTPWVSMPKENFDWLIQQAEKIELFNAEIETLQAKWEAQGLMIQKLHRENQRYKQALEFYADEEAYETKFARKALG